MSSPFQTLLAGPEITVRLSSCSEVWSVTRGTVEVVESTGEEKEEEDLLRRLFLRKVNEIVFSPPRYFHSSDENSHQDHYFSVKWIPAACVLREMNLFPTIDKWFIIYFNTGSFMPFSTDAHFICISHFCRIVPFTLRALSPHSYKGRFNCRVPVLGMMPLTTCIKCSCLAAKNFQDWTVSPA